MIFAYILAIALVFAGPVHGQDSSKEENAWPVDFLGETHTLKAVGSIQPPGEPLASKQSITLFLKNNYEFIQQFTKEINNIKREKNLSDWYHYQLIRRVAQQLTPKEKDYFQYTAVKFMLLHASGFSPLLAYGDQKLLLYIASNNTIYNLPIKKIGNQQYVCMNYHDYAYSINFNQIQFEIIEYTVVEHPQEFNYAITSIPKFTEQGFTNKTISFNYRGKKQSISIEVQPESMDYFRNYPVIDYRFQFNVPFSQTVYNSLIPTLRSKTKHLSTRKGVEYLMIFVRDGFEFETDTKYFGREKRLSPEETILSEKSDCEDRSALFFVLVKELYNLPMIVLSYPEHVNVGVWTSDKRKNQYWHNTLAYSIYEPTPQTVQSKEYLKNMRAEVAYEYLPKK